VRQTSLQQYDYHLWANEKIFKHLKGLPREVYHEELQSVFPSISEALVHIYNVDTIWLCVMAGDSFDQIMQSMARVTEETKGKTIEELNTLFYQLSDKYKARKLLHGHFVI
jgi:uncharacterized damage-inducible protein DinB